MADCQHENEYYNQRYHAVYCRDCGEYVCEVRDRQVTEDSIHVRRDGEFVEVEIDV